MISKKKIIYLIIFVLFWVSVSRCMGSWLIYHKPEFKGKVVDAETKEPIEEAVVVVVYKKHDLISGPGGGYTYVVKVKEVLTDKNGDFRITSYTTMIQPNSIEDDAEFIIYKPGYGSYPGLQTSPPWDIDPEYFFTQNFGNKEERQIRIDTVTDDRLVQTKTEYQTFTYGIVELPKLMTKKERLRAMPSTPTDIGSKELPILYKIMNEENKRFGLGEEK